MSWYKSTPIKVILLIMEHIFAMVAVMALVAYLACPSVISEAGEVAKKYEDTKAFAYDLQNVSLDIMASVNVQEWPDAIDVIEYEETGNAMEENQSGLTFYMKDLLNIKGGDTEGEIWVRKKSDGTYVYQTWMEYRNDESEYEDSWITYETVPRTLQTVEGKTLLQIVNTDARWNGKFNEAQDAIKNVASIVRDRESSYATIRENYAEGNTNLSYLYVDYAAGKVFSNHAKYTDIKQVEAYVKELKEKGKYIVTTNRLADFETNTALRSDELENPYVSNYLYAVAIDTTYPIQDIIRYKAEDFKALLPIVRGLFLSGVISVVGFVIGFIWLSCIAGRGKKEKEIESFFIDRIPVEIMTAVGALGAFLGFWLFADNETIFYTSSAVQLSELMGGLALAAFSTLVVCASCFAVYFSFIRRIKARMFVESMFVVRVWNLCKGFVKQFEKHQKCIVKGLVYYGIYLVVSWVIRIGCTSYGWSAFMAVGAIIDLVVLGKIIQRAISRDVLEKGVKQIAEGDMKYQINTTGLATTDVSLAEYVNHIGDGFGKAVEQSMKDERLKTELLTNVSHDIKTPLTSIINYVELLKREDIQDETIQGYITVLEQKAARLKQLTEDVTEASKISSGNITIEYQDLDFVQMIQQTAGEFAEKFEKRSLSMITDIPSEPVIVRVDGRRMWRIIENLYNNVAKYAMPGTRVYATLSMENAVARFSLKNISEQPLNISAEELTERFIRGDVARSTEGSGLGLSIAKELTKLQGGEFELYLDGDLFKVTVKFPCKK